MSVFREMAIDAGCRGDEVLEAERYLAERAEYEAWERAEYEAWLEAEHHASLRVNALEEMLTPGWLL